MVIRIALVGNPNAGKTTMFNKLTGSSQYVGNWPGVTVERKEGKLKDNDDTVIVDLPGIYSLSPYSPEEIVSRDFLLKDRPDAIINIVDAANLERNLYLTTQILEIGIPTVIALNKMDAVRKEGTVIHIDKLSKALGCGIVETSASKGEGVDDLVEAVMKAVGAKTVNVLRYSHALEKHISKAENAIRGKVPKEAERWYSLKLLEKDERVNKEVGSDVAGVIAPIVSHMEEETGNDADSIIVEERYSLIGRTVGHSVTWGIDKKRETRSDRIDRIVTSRRYGLPIFALIMFAIFFIAIRAVGGWGTTWINDTIHDTVMPAVESWLINAGVADWMTGLIVDGIINGVGAVICFLPQLLVLFLVLVILEECGYMARVAFLMDHVFRRFGLSGKSFIPMLIGMGCGVPGILASRSIEGESERKITAMTVTFMPCSAKLPAIALISGALFGQSALVAVSMYFIGIACILMSGIILRKWKSLSGTPSPFIMEIPPYHVPAALSVIRSTLERAWSFVKMAGTFILLACVAVWFLSSFNTSFAMVDAQDSMLAGIGNSLKWIFVPLGFGDDWEFTMATLTGLLAKENIVGTLSILFGSGGSGGSIWDIIGGILTKPAGFAFLVFNMMCAPCFAAVTAMKMELGSWKATGKAVLYQCTLAYVLAMVIYQFTTIFFGNGPEWWLIPAVVALAVLIYVLVAKEPFSFFRRAKQDA